MKCTVHDPEIMGWNLAQVKLSLCSPSRMDFELQYMWLFGLGVTCVDLQVVSMSTIGRTIVCITGTLCMMT